MAANIAPEQLTEENYEKWSACMKNYLIANDLWDIIEPPNQEEEAAADFKAWQKKKAAALYVLQISCSLKLFPIIKHLDSAKACWDTLAQKFQRKDEELKEEEKDDEAKEEEEKKDEEDRFQPLWKAIDEGNSNAVIEFLKSHPDAVKQRNNKGMIALQLAVDNDKADVVKEILEFMSEEDFQNFDHDDGPLNPSLNPFNLACWRGSLRIVDLLLTRHEKFAEIPSWYRLPVAWACRSGNRKLTRYLYLRTPFKSESLPRYINETAYDVLRFSIEQKSLDIALDLFNRVLGDLDSSGPRRGGYLLLALSNNSDLFPRHIHFSFRERWLYSGIRVKLPPDTHPVDIRIPMMEQDYQMNSSNILIPVFVRLWRSLSSSVQQLSGYKQIYDLKLTHCYATELLHLAFQNIPRRQCIVSKYVKDALFNAAEQGIVEIFVAALNHDPDLSYIRNDEGRSLFQQAIEFRQGKIFMCVYALPDELKKEALFGFDRKGNDSLDIAGMLASQTILAKISNPALQMQCELKWFKEVANVCCSIKGENISDDIIERASQKFTENHKELKGKAEKWYKGTANSSSVVGTLFITIMFTAAFTVPGGNNSNTGLPIFLNEWAFKFYILADAISLINSSTYVFAFFGIITARYEENDFLVSLPRKLIIAISSLFISIAAMMICFLAAVVIILHGDLKLIIPIALLALGPVPGFISLQFPLLQDFFYSTYRSNIFE